MVLMTVNILLGLLVTTNYHIQQKLPFLKLHQRTYFKIHNWNAYLAISVALLHPTLLLLSSTAGFKLGDILLPLHSPHQTLYNNLGACAIYLFAFVVVTSYLRPKLGYRPWKKM